MAARQANDAHLVPPGSILLVVHDFSARSQDELTLSKGDRIELIERDDDFGDGWFLGRHMNNGMTGLFPEVYTTPAPKGTLPTGAAQRRQNPFSPNPGYVDQQLDGGRNNLAGDTASAAASASQSSQSSQRPASSGSAHSTMSLRTSGQQPRGLSQVSSQHNSVMHETLSVIDEHITDMRTPRQSYLSVPRGVSSSHDADSVYSSHTGHRLSYINGHETDEEENTAHTEAEILTWSPGRVAEHLEDSGVEKEHCDIFREQEISGEVLLQMEQSAVFIKEFELGSVGRRLKTWQKIKALQDEVRANSARFAPNPRSVSEYSGAGDESMNDMTRARSASITASNVHVRPATANPSPGGPRFDQSQPGPSASPSLTSLQMSPRPENNTSRPSAQSIRSMNHSRRHSSVGSLEVSANRHSHHRQSSASASISAAAKRLSTPHELAGSPLLKQDTSAAELGFGAGFGVTASPTEIDRGYFSGNELDSRNKRNVLQKKSSPRHSRNISSTTDPTRNSGIFRALGRVASAESVRDAVSPVPASSHFRKANASRAVSTPQTTAYPASPVVTKLDYGQSPVLGESEPSSTNPSPSPASHTFSFFSKPRIGGLRVASDAITKNEKQAQAGAKSSPITSPTRTGSTTPSTDTRSIELQKSEQSRVSTGSSSAIAPPPPASRSRPKPKNKKSTSAYTRGLEKKPPAEQIATCDYSGWMKKKSSNLMGSWKPRLFVLRGRRLSYYYSEDDTEEKGLIDISSHRVLPAENEKMTGLHAALTGASSSPITPQTASASTTAPDSGAQGIFIFKLVPPRQGLSKAVNFTKPTVHYFAVNSRQEGRLWMAALMKATIDYDPSGKVVTSYSQNTISLAKARARKERPPTLVDDKEDRRRGGGGAAAAAAGEESSVSPAELQGDSTPSSTDVQKGLGIGGLDGSAAPADQTAAGAGAQDIKEDSGATNGNDVPA